MNNAFSLYFIVIFDWLLYFLQRNVFLRDFSQNQVHLLTVGMWECSSVVEHSTAYREVGGSIPLAPFFIIVGLFAERL